MDNQITTKDRFFAQKELSNIKDHAFLNALNLIIKRFKENMGSVH